MHERSLPPGEQDRDTCVFECTARTALSQKDPGVPGGALSDLHIPRYSGRPCCTHSGEVYRSSCSIPGRLHPEPPRVPAPSSPSCAASLVPPVSRIGYRMTKLIL